MLLGEGDADFVREVDSPVQPAKVMYAGLDEWTASENETLNKLDLRRTGSKELADGSASILQWIETEGITHIAVHFDVDAISPRSFRPILFNKPDPEEDFLAGVPGGRIEPVHLVRLLRDVDEACHIVGLAITEYMAWDALQTRKLLAHLPLVGTVP